MDSDAGVQRQWIMEEIETRRRELPPGERMGNESTTGTQGEGDRYVYTRAQK